MSWRDRLRPASFRGLPFFVAEAESTFARNVVAHEYPGQAVPFFEDLGRRGRVRQVEGYVVGDDYQDQRDRLIDACDETAGAGDLVHPYYGTLSVLCRELRTRESSSEGRMARLLFTFEEAGDALAPESVEDPDSGILDATGSLYTASADDFAQAWNPDDQPAVLVQAGAAQAQSFLDYLQNLQLSGPVTLIGVWRDQLANVIDTTLADLQSPFVYAGKVQALLTSLLDVIGSRRAAIEAFLGLGKVKASPSFGFSTASQQADSNRDCVGRLYREHAAALAARASAESTWTSYPEAVSARDRAIAALHAAQDAAGDGAFLRLGEVEAALAAALPLAPGTLPGLETFNVRESTSALVVAYRLYDDVARAQEIADRNRIDDPLIIRGGSALEVLARA